MNQARVKVLKETKKDNPGGFTLCFQYCRYEFTDGWEENGYRFIWRRPDGSLQAARGQARIPSITVAQELMQQAIDEGWGDHCH